MPATQLAIGPSNYAGQATAWARAVQRHLDIDAWSFSGVPLRGGGFSFDIDRLIPKLSFRNPALHGARTRRFLRGVTHVALDGFKSFHRWDRHATFPSDARAIADSGKQVALIAHGSDVREPAAHLARDPWSYFAAGDDTWRRTMTEQTARNRAFADEAGWPVFYSTPDLAFDLPNGEWLPVVVDVDAWASDAPLLERERPLVVHVPSQRNPPIKGTHLIVPVLQDLHDQGVIEFVAPSSMPHSALRELVRTCDVVVDQLLFGSYGVAAVEALAAGRVAVGRLSPEVAGLMEEAPEFLEATPETLREVISSVQDRRDELRAVAQRGVAFARRWHDGAVSAERLRGYLS
ncbi:MAG TPA: hypothetical protein K8V15_09895 [Tessaracoccus flavescens]|uniref:Glycosyl transferase family 1 domain-containing protein n=1 Tax=Tessaracoccus flavescens TaxID=399497 RepID=A0A921EPM2_9ACTN|nr:hypothetical protein [Tessaracoccus flavescens]